MLRYDMKEVEYWIDGSECNDEEEWKAEFRVYRSFLANKWSTLSVSLSFSPNVTSTLAC
jgi:hypothetical protein